MHLQGDSRLTPSMQHKSHYDIRQTQQCVHGRDISAPLHYKQRVEAEEETLFSPVIGQLSSNRHSHWLKTTLYYSLIESMLHSTNIHTRSMIAKAGYGREENKLLDHISGTTYTVVPCQAAAAMQIMCHYRLLCQRILQTIIRQRS